MMIAQPSNIRGRAECCEAGCAWWFAERCVVIDLAISAGSLTEIYDGLQSVCEAVNGGAR